MTTKGGGGGGYSGFDPPSLVSGQLTVAIPKMFNAVETWFSEPLYNEFLRVTNDFL